MGHLQDILAEGRESSNKRSRRYDAEHEALMYESRITRTKRAYFLESCGARATSIEEYALWLATWLHHGGKVTHYWSWNFGGYFTPTMHTGTPIPVGYGANSMKLLVVADQNNQFPVPLYPTSADWRSSWEWGHTSVLTLRRKDDFIYQEGSSPLDAVEAKTNNSYVVESFPDVENLIGLIDQTRYGRSVIERLALP